MARENTLKKETNNVTYRYILEPYRSASSRTTCPNCKGKHCFARYVDVTTGEILSDKFGRCDRVERCGYFESPYGKDIDDKQIMVPTKKVMKEYKEKIMDYISTINPNTLIKSMTLNDNFSKFLLENFDYNTAKESLLKYKVGESDRWPGSTIFWQIDMDFDIRTGKIIHYDEKCKRTKKPYPRISWAHVPQKKMEVIPDYNLQLCMFGEHLVTDEFDTVHVVEAEKTAIICDIQTENQLWLAVGGLELVSPERFQRLEGKKIIFYPDKGDKAFNKWSTKLNPLIEAGWNISINRSIEKTELEEGSDLADIILNKLNKNEKSI